MACGRSEYSSRVKVRKGVAARGLAGDDPFPCRRLRIVDGRAQSDKHTTQQEDVTSANTSAHYGLLLSNQQEDALLHTSSFVKPEIT